MVNKTMSIAKEEVVTKLKKDIFDITKEAYLQTIPGIDSNKYSAESKTYANTIATKFASTFADKISPVIGNAIVDIVSQAHIIGTVNSITTGTCAAGPTAGTGIGILTGTELILK